jgi:hypothetical protein
MPRTTSHLRCPCYLCKNRIRHAETVKIHETNALFVNVDYNNIEDLNFEADIIVRPVNNQTSGKRAITEETRALLDAYDLYFATEDRLNEELWVLHSTTHNFTHCCHHIYTICVRPCLHLPGR